MRQIPALFAFNRGLVSPLSLARVDQKRLALSAEEMVNYRPRMLGYMSLRPGLQHIGATLSNLAARFCKFIFSTTDTALMEFTDGAMRIWVNDELVTRVSVSSAVTNGNFDSNLTGWTDSDEAGASSVWVSGGYMGLTGTGTNAAIRDQQVSVIVGDFSKEHALRIIVERGPVVLLVGSSAGDDDYIAETTLGTGTHSLAFTPTGNIHIRFMNRLLRQTLVSSCNIESSGVMSITSPYVAADLGKIRYDQSADVVFIACVGYQQRKVERRGTTSWSIVLYEPEDGPFRTENVDDSLTIASSATTGNVTLTSSRAYFKSDDVGALFRITSQGQNVTASVSAQNTFTSSIRVTGSGTARSFSISLTGTWVATVTLQRSFDNGVSWIDVTTYAANTATTYSDGLTDQEVLYRIGVKTGGYTSGTAVLDLAYSLGSITGYVKITAYTNATTVSAEVLSELGGTSATAVWSEGEWSDYRGWPSAVRFHEGRLWWSGKNGIWGSISDAFDSFNQDFEGDAGPINRTIGSGPVDTINWLLSLQRLLIGAQSTEFSARSSSLDEPLTPTNFNLKPASTIGSYSVDPTRIDQRGVYVDRSGIRVYELAFDGQSYDYNSSEMTTFNPELCSAGIVRLDAQRKPDTMIHCVLADGTTAICMYDRQQDVMCWFTYETDGLVEDVVVLPGDNGSTEDKVYYVVNRTVNGSTVRYLERFAVETECRGANSSKQCDSFITFSNSPASTSISGLSHLVGESVVVWQDGFTPEDPDTGLPKTYTVSSLGTIRLDIAASVGVVGLPYTASFKSAKLGTQTSINTPLNQQKRLSHMGLVLAYAHIKGIVFGPDFDHLDDMPGVEEGVAVSDTLVRTSYDEQVFPFPGVWTTDMRLCMKSYAPRPVTIMSATLDLEEHD